MKICIWFDTTDQPWGGGNQFLRALSQALTTAGHELVTVPGNADVVLINAHNTGPSKRLYPGTVAQVRHTGKITGQLRFLPSRPWTLFPRRGPALVHRLDGVAELVRGRKSMADFLVPAINRLTDFTIFQSDFCLQSFAKFGVCPRNSRTILNGVDGRIFAPFSGARNLDRVFRFLGVSWSPNPRKGFAVLAALSKIAGVEVQFAGRWCETIDPSNVKQLGQKTSTELAEVMRRSDALIHAAENEPCSNAILEALACGLPILYLNSGGNGELAGPYGVIISGNLQDDVERLRTEYSTLREKVRSAHDRFLIGPVAERYVQSFESALRLRNAGTRA